MDLYLISASKNPDVSKPLLDRIAEALEFQLYQHVAPFWQITGCRVLALSTLEALPITAGASPLIIYDTPDQAGVLGWHTYNAQEGRIHGTAFLKPILDNGGGLIDGAVSLSSVLSHEAIEAVLDPYVNLMAFKDAKTLEPVEGCDRVQGDNYDVSGVSVSNFLGPRAFRDGPGPYDWLRKLQDPWAMTPGGYNERLDVNTGVWKTTYGETMPQWQRDLKELKSQFKLSRLAQRKHRHSLLA
jgi:hypothetical protein